MARGIRYYITSGFDNKGAVAAQKSVAALGKSFLKATIGIGTATAAISKMNAVLKESVQSALAEEKAQTALNKVLENSGFGPASQQVGKFIDQMQFATGVSEDQLRPAFTQLFNSLGSVTKAQTVLNTAMNVSAATGRDLSSVTAALAKAAAGSNTAISRLGLGIQKADLATMSFDEIVAKLESKFSGSAAAAAETMSGKIDRLRIASAEAKEEIGKGLLAAFDTLSKEGGADIDSLTTKMVGLGTATGDFIRGIAIISNKAQGGGLFGDFGKSVWQSFTQNLPPWVKIGATGLKIVTAVGSEQRRMENLGLGGSYMTYQANKRLATLEKKNLETKTKITKTEAKTTKEKARQLALSRKMAMFDEELIQIAAARTRGVNAETLARLNLMEQIALQQLGLTAAPAALAAASNITTGPNAGQFRLAEAGANLGLGYSGQPLTPLTPAGTPTGGVVNNTININALSTMDVQEAVAAAVNNGSRAGLAYTQVFSRL